MVFFMVWRLMAASRTLRSIGFGGMECRSFDVRVVCDEFAVGVGSFSARAYVARDRGALGRRGIGEFGVA